MKKTFKGALALAFCIVTVFATMLVASAIGAPKAKVGKITYNSVTISWAKVKDADFYEVQRSTDGKKWTTLNKAVKGTSYKDSSKLTAGKSYKYRVRAIEDRIVLSDIYSSWSKTVSAKPVPEKVTSLKAASRTYNSVKLSWKKVSGASGYEVQMLKDGKWKSYKKTTSTSLNVTKLKLGTTYQFRVRAYRTVSKKAVYGAVSSVLKTGPVLQAPSTFVLKGVSTSSLKLAWSSVTGAKGYEVYNTVTKKWTDVKTKKTLTVKNLKAGTKYGFIVRAYSGKYDGTKTATRTYITAPAAPKSLKNTKATTNALTFSWDKVTGTAGYQLQYSTDGKTWKSLATTTSTSATVSSLANGTKYTVRVRAYVKNSNVKDISATAYGSWSAKVTAYTMPAAPGSISYTDITASTVSIKWNKVSGAIGYEVYNPVTKKWVDTKTATTYKFSSLKNATDYTFKVRAYLNSTRGAEKSITVTTAPAKATGIKISDITTTSFKAAWSKVTGADGYRIYIYDYSANKQTTLTNTTALSYTFKDLKTNTKYKIGIRAYVKNSSGNTYTDTTWYDGITTYALNTIPVTWSNVSGANKYVVERFNPETFAWDAVTTTSSLSCRDDSQGVNSAALYRISAYKDSTLISSVQKEVSNSGITVSKATNTMTVSWTAPVLDNSKGVSFYSVFELPRKGSGETEEKLVYVLDPSKTSHTIFTAHGTEQTYVIYAHSDILDSAIITNYISKAEKKQAVATFTVRAEELAINDTDTSKTGQLLMLVDAINRSKYYQGNVTITRDSTSTLNTDELSIEASVGVLPLLFIELPELKKYANSQLVPTKLTAQGADEIVEFMNTLDGKNSVKKDEITKNETVKETVSFDRNICFSSVTKKSLLHYYIQPNELLPYTAYLYKADNASAWKNGFSSVSTNKSNGNYKLTATIKAEDFGTSLNKAQTFYHGGFCSPFETLDFSGAEGMENERTTITATTITAEINSDGQLVSYTFSNTSMSSNFSVDMEGMVKMNLKVSGSEAFKYDFVYEPQS